MPKTSRWNIPTDDKYKRVNGVVYWLVEKQLYRLINTVYIMQSINQSINIRLLRHGKMQADKIKEL